MIDKKKKQYWSICLLEVSSPLQQTTTFRFRTFLKIFPDQLETKQKWRSFCMSFFLSFFLSKRRSFFHDTDWKTDRVPSLSIERQYRWTEVYLSLETREKHLAFTGAIRERERERKISFGNGDRGERERKEHLAHVFSSRLHFSLSLLTWQNSRSRIFSDSL